MKKVEVVTVGNEILMGAVLDSNSHWICKQISGLGGQVERVVLVPDDVGAIAREIDSALSRKADLIFTLGGLGPTADDLTLEAVARSARRPLTVNDEALSLVRAKYEQLHREGSIDSAEFTEERRKMAILPEGAVPLKNDIGAAPGVLLRLESGQLVVSLPGVPDEMKGIVANSLAPVLRDMFGSGAFLERTLVSDCKDESVLSPILRRVSGQFADVYIKSRARRFGPDVRFHITLAARGESREKIAERLEEAHHALEDALQGHGIHILEVRE
jgi:nicotinamide-nucleotide amidase